MSVKLYFNNEIRRFPLESLANGLTFVSLVQKIHQIYPNLIGKSIKLYWKDHENDKIIFKTDDELKEVLRNCVDDVLRIFIEENGETLVEKCTSKIETDAVSAPIVTETQTPPTETVDPTLHVGVVCDACDGAIKGLRYKCLTCPDFDLCESCEAKHLHNQHPMIRIVNPQDDAWRKAFFTSHIRNGHGKCHGRRRMREGVEASASASASADSNSQNQPNIHAGVQFLRNVGEAVAAALNGFGIDVDIDVEHDGVRQKVPESTKPSEEKPETPQPAAEHVVVPKADVVEATADGIKKMDINESVYPKLDNIETTPTEPINQQGWTLLEKPDEAKDTLKAPTLIPVTSTTCEPAQIVHHPDPYINAAVESMINMGFANEGGWLTSLLVSKGGNISAVLDVLQPAKKF